MRSEFPVVCPDYVGADMARPHLKPETDSQDRNTKIRDRIIKRRRFGMHRRRAAGNNNASRSYAFNVLCANPCGIYNKTVYAELLKRLFDQVVKLAPHRKKKEYFVGLAYLHLSFDIGERFWRCSCKGTDHFPLQKRLNLS